MIIETQKWANKSRNVFTQSIWRVMRYDMQRAPDIARFIAREKFAWPGGYELFAVTDDGAALCFDCCRAQYRAIRAATPGDGWNVAALESAANCDSAVACDHCSRTIVPGD